jgi:hypothetical protein
LPLGRDVLEIPHRQIRVAIVVKVTDLQSCVLEVSGFQ